MSNRPINHAKTEQTSYMFAHSISHAVCCRKLHRHKTAHKTCLTGSFTYKCLTVHIQRQVILSHSHIPTNTFWGGGGWLVSIFKTLVLIRRAPLEVTTVKTINPLYLVSSGGEGIRHKSNMFHFISCFY